MAGSARKAGGSRCGSRCGSRSAAGLNASAKETALLPEDLSVTGFDNAALAARNGITTVSQDFGEMAKMALNMIFYQLANPALINNCSGVSHIRSVLWERWSTAPRQRTRSALTICRSLGRLNGRKTAGA